MTITGVTDTTSDFIYNLQLYLTGDGHALVISVDSADVLGGLGWQQASTSFNPASVSGSYALNVAQFITPNEQDGVGSFYADGASTLTGFLDVNGTFTSAGPVPDKAFANAFGTTATNGVFGITGSGWSATLLTAYLVDGTQGAIIENDATALTLGYFAPKH